jgi:hypothetical protein
MGNNSVIKNSKNTFVEQIKVDSRSESKILGCYINPIEFPNSGLIVVSNRGRYNL